MARKSKVIFESTALKSPTKIRTTGREPVNKVNTTISGKNYSREKASSELDKLVLESARIILDITAVFPFNFFPDVVIADESKVSVHTKYFFYSKEVRSMEYKDIFNVAVQEGVFFASLEIVDRYFTQVPLVIPYLRKKDALLARRIIQGMIIAKAENINFNEIPVDELVEKLNKIGRSR